MRKVGGDRGKIHADRGQPIVTEGDIREGKGLDARGSGTDQDDDAEDEKRTGKHGVWGRRGKREKQRRIMLY